MIESTSDPATGGKLEDKPVLRTIDADPQNALPILIEVPNETRTYAVATAGRVRQFCKRRWPGTKELWLHVVHTDPNVLFAVLEQGYDSVVDQTVAITREVVVADETPMLAVELEQSQDRRSKPHSAFVGRQQGVGWVLQVARGAS